MEITEEDKKDFELEARGLCSQPQSTLACALAGVYVFLDKKGLLKEWDDFTQKLVSEYPELKKELH